MHVQVLRQYARESYGLVTQEGWSRDSEAYLLMLRVAVDMQMACEAAGAAESDSDPCELLRDVLREWSLQTRDVGAPQPPSHACMHACLPFCFCQQLFLCQDVLHGSSGSRLRLDVHVPPIHAPHALQARSLTRRSCGCSSPTPSAAAVCSVLWRRISDGTSQTCRDCCSHCAGTTARPSRRSTARLLCASAPWPPPPPRTRRGPASVRFRPLLCAPRISSPGAHNPSHYSRVHANTGQKCRGYRPAAACQVLLPYNCSTEADCGTKSVGGEPCALIPSVTPQH